MIQPANTVKHGKQQLQQHRNATVLPFLVLHKFIVIITSLLSLFVQLTFSRLPVFSFSALTLMVGWQKGHLAHKNPIPLILTGSLPEHVEEDTKRLID